MTAPNGIVQIFVDPAVTGNLVRHIVERHLPTPSPTQGIPGLSLVLPDTLVEVEKGALPCSRGFADYLRTTTGGATAGWLDGDCTSGAGRDSGAFNGLSMGNDGWGAGWLP